LLALAVDPEPLRRQGTSELWQQRVSTQLLRIGSPKFGAVLLATPVGALGGIETALFGMIGVLGARIWIEGKVNFTDSTNLIIAATALVIGISDMAWTRGQYTFTGIVNATLVAVIGYQVLSMISKSRGNSPR
jgi:xanthine/uracil permease